MKKRVIIFLFCSVLIAGCSEITIVNTASDSHSISAETDEAEILNMEKEEEEEVTGAEIIEFGQEEAGADVNKPIFKEFEDLYFFQNYYGQDYFCLWLSNDGTFEGEIKTFTDSVDNKSTYNRFSGSFEAVETIDTGIYRLYMKELYLLYEPESTITMPGENGEWVADSLTSLVRGRSFYLCLKNADIKHLSREIEGTSFYHKLTENSVLQSNYLLIRNISYGYQIVDDYFYTDPHEQGIDYISKFTDTVTGLNRRNLVPFVYTIGEACFGVLNYKQIENEEDIYDTTYLLFKDYDDDSYFLNYMEVSNFGKSDVSIDNIKVETIKYIPLEELDYLCSFAGDGDSVPKVKGLFAEIDPFESIETPVTQADLYYPYEDAFPEVIPTFETFQGDSITNEKTIIYVVGLDFKKLGYYKYCFNIEYTQDNVLKRVSTAPMELLVSDISEFEFWDFCEEFSELRSADT